MTRYAPLWQQGSTYPAQFDRQLFAALWPLGGASGVMPTVVNNQLQVSVPAGIAAVPLSGLNGVALCRWDTAEVVTFGGGPGAGTSRMDLLCVQVRDNALDSGGNNDFIMTAVAGVAQAGPVAPAVPANAYALCQVLVPSGAGNLNLATLTDRRTPIQPVPAYARVGRNAGWTTAGSATPIIFDTVLEWTGQANYNTTNGRYTCPATGRYLITACAAAQGTAANQYMRLDAMKNGAVVMSGPYVIIPSALGIYAPMTAVVRCVTGDWLQVGHESNPAGLAGTANTAFVWATFDYLGP